jgi:hypothetical protein
MRVDWGRGGGENKQREKERERAKGEKEREGSEAGKGVARPGTLDNHRTTWRRGASRKSVGQLDLQGRKKKWSWPQNTQAPGVETTESVDSGIWEIDLLHQSDHCVMV